MGPVLLRPVVRDDLSAIRANKTEEADPWNFFGHRDDGGLDNALAANGLLSEDSGTLAVETPAGDFVGTVNWFAVMHGPSPACRALNVGISLFSEWRGQGLGGPAQRALASYLFGTTVVERLQAGTDIDNIPEQRALEKAGFSREGVLRHAQFRQGAWRDMVLYGLLRGDIALH
jgi:RimJ/RimL family protein N-acetyltransferase